MEKNLWRSLVKSDTKYEIFCPPDLQISLEIFFAGLKANLEANRIPAHAEMCNITWDSTTVEQKRIIVQLNSSSELTDSNMLQILIGLDSIGAYTYIEEKVFLEKPTLPVFPRAKDPTPEPKADGCLLTVGLIFYIIPGLLYYEHIKRKRISYASIREHNELAEKEKREECVPNTVEFEGGRQRREGLIYLSCRNKESDEQEGAVANERIPEGADEGQGEH